MEKDKTFELAVFLLRVGMGWILTYAALDKLFNPEWSAKGYMMGAKTLTSFYHWLASSGNIGWGNFLNEWVVLLLGLALMFGVLTRWASLGGILLMLLYYLPVLQFPYAGEHALLVDEHVIYTLVFFLLFAADAGRFWGLDTYLKKTTK